MPGSGGEQKKILVVGLGNELLQDDGAGVHARTETNPAVNGADVVRA